MDYKQKQNYENDDCGYPWSVEWMHELDEAEYGTLLGFKKGQYVDCHCGLSKVLVQMKKTGPTTSKEIPQKILGFVCFEDESDSKRLYLQPRVWRWCERKKEVGQGK